MPTRSDDHYFSAQPEVDSNRRKVDLALPDLSLSLVTDAGVFSADGVDPGTKLLLLEAPALPASGTFLDLGCGYGPIAVTMARRSPGATVYAVDVNERALELTRLNAKTAGVGDRVIAAAADDVPADIRFDVIWSNPPIRIGKAALHELLTTWLSRLSPSGVAVLVVQKHLGSDSLAAWLGESGYAVERLRSRGGYRLLEVRPCDR